MFKLDRMGTVSLPLAGLSLLLIAAPALAQTPDTTATPVPSAVRTLHATPRTGEIQLDGRLDEAAWDSVGVANNFTQSYPNPGAEPTQRTEARVLYDDAALYVGVRMYDTAPDSIAAQLARRDATGIYSDWVHVLVESYHDGRTAFRFSVNPLGVKKDVFHFNDTNEDVDWDAVWQVATQVDSLGWTAEYRIPLSQIRFSGDEPAGGRVWGLQIQRDIARRDERDSWSPWTRQDPGYVSRFGDLAGLRGIEPVRRLELVPYASSRLSRAPNEPGNPFYSENDAGANVGVDVKLGITSGLTLTGTINPDFGQVEVDPAVVNLSAFETFFPEKRPFFVEGADIFRFGEVRSNNNFQFEEYFYSRRVGRAPQRRLAGADEILYVDAPDQSTILGAAKVSGKVGPWTLGVMDAFTGEEEARYITDAGERFTAPVEPLSNYFVGRLRRDLREGSTVVGGMVTATHRDMGDSVFSPLLRSRALFGGVDFEHSWASRLWTVSGYLAGSRVDGSEEVIAATQRSPARYYQRPDAEYVELDSTRTSLSGHMAELALQGSVPTGGGGNWVGSLDYKETGPGFEINDLGFQGRTDYRSVNTLLGRGMNQPGPIFRNYSAYAFTTHAWNFGGEQIGRYYGVGADGNFVNLWSARLNASFNPGSDDDRLTRGGPLARSPAEWTLSGRVESDSRKRFSYGADGRYGESSAGGNSGAVDLTFDFRPSSAVRLRLSPEVEWGHGTAQFVTSVRDPLVGPEFGGRRYVFADIDQTVVSMNTRLDWTFSPNLSLQLFAQPFVAAGDYRDFKEFLEPGEYDFAVYGEEVGAIAFNDSTGRYTVDPDGAGPSAPFAFSNRDFNVRSLRGNAVLRWEYRPGSAFFFVWQQQREGIAAVGTFDFGRDVGEVFTAPATNVFLIKATYWIGR